MAITDLSKFTSNCRACGKPLNTLRVFYGDVYHPECTAGRDVTSDRSQASCSICRSEITPGDKIVLLPSGMLAHKFCFMANRKAEDGAMRMPKVGEYVEWVQGYHSTFIRGAAYRVERVGAETFTVSSVPGSWYWTGQFRIVPQPTEAQLAAQFAQSDTQNSTQDNTMRYDAPLAVGDWVEWIDDEGKNELRRGVPYEVTAILSPRPTFRLARIKETSREWYWNDPQFRIVSRGKPPSPPKVLTWAESRFVGLILE